MSKAIGLVALLALVLPQILSAATIVEDRAFSIVGPGPSPTTQTFRVLGRPEVDTQLFDFTDFRVRPTDGANNMADLVHRGGFSGNWYFTDLDELFSLDSIAIGSHELWGRSSTELETSKNVPINSDIWIGFESTDEEERWQNFGWVQLRIDDNLDVSLVDNAMAFDSDRIVIGRNVVPEPAASWMFLIGLLAVGHIRRATTDRLQVRISCSTVSTAIHHGHN